MVTVLKPSGADEKRSPLTTFPICEKSTVKPRFFVFIGGPEKNDGCGTEIDAGTIV
jgi:hypothetical protein